MTEVEVGDRHGERIAGEKTRTVGIVVPGILTPFFPAVVKAVEYALHHSAMSLLLCNANESPGLEADRLDAARSEHAWRDH